MLIISTSTITATVDCQGRSRGANPMASVPADRLAWTVAWPGESHGKASCRMPWPADRLLQIAPVARPKAAVADATEPDSDAPAAAADSTQPDSEPGESSIAGETIGAESADELAGLETESAVAEWMNQRQKRAHAESAPLEPMQGEIPRHKSSKYNKEREVGNCGLYLGNWGQRPSVLTTDAARIARRNAQDLQIQKNPGNVVVILESAAEVATMLASPAAVADPFMMLASPSGEARRPDLWSDLGSEREGRNATEHLESRPENQHYVIRGDAESCPLIAARRDTCTGIECLMNDVNADSPYTEKGKDKIAWTKTLVCKIGFKQNVGHIGKQLVVCGCHAHNRTMKIEWPKPWEKFWNRLFGWIVEYGIHFLCGDFNMSLTKVVPELRKRGLMIDCVAWYPWLHTGAHGNDNPPMQRLVEETPLGLDSCGIFFIGGTVEVRMPWGIEQIEQLLDVSGDADLLVTDTRSRGLDRQGRPLDVHDGMNTPGQTWICYRGEKYNEKAKDKNLRARLEELLEPSTTRAELMSIPKREGSFFCPYLRLNSKRLDREAWQPKGAMHNGAHMPLCVWTNNSSARSEPALQKRRARAAAKAQQASDNRRGKHTSQGKTAVAKGHTEDGKTRGKGTSQGKTAVAKGHTEDGKTQGKGLQADSPPPWRRGDTGQPAAEKGEGKTFFGKPADKAPTWWNGTWGGKQVWQDSGGGWQDSGGGWQGSGGGWPADESASASGCHWWPNY